MSVSSPQTSVCPESPFLPLPNYPNHPVMFSPVLIAFSFRHFFFQSYKLVAFPLKDRFFQPQNIQYLFASIVQGPCQPPHVGCVRVLLWFHVVLVTWVWIQWRADEIYARKFCAAVVNLFLIL